MLRVVVMLFVLAFSVAASAAQSRNGAPQATASDPSVSNAYEIAVRNQPSASDVIATPTKPTSSLDDYTQERWRIKLSTIVPYILVATPIILLIVLVTIRSSGVRSPEHLMLAAALVLVIQATLTVSLTAEGSDALSASMGILGAIAGYLFGRARGDTSPPPPVDRTPPTLRKGAE